MRAIAGRLPRTESPALYSRIKNQSGCQMRIIKPVVFGSSWLQRRPAAGARDVLRVNNPSGASKPTQRIRKDRERPRSRRRSGRSTASSQSRGENHRQHPCRTTMKPSGKSMPRSTSHPHGGRASRRGVSRPRLRDDPQGKRRPDPLS